MSLHGRHKGTGLSGTDGTGQHNGTISTGKTLMDIESRIGEIRNAQQELHAAGNIDFVELETLIELCNREGVKYIEAGRYVVSMSGRGSSKMILEAKAALDAALQQMRDDPDAPEVKEKRIEPRQPSDDELLLNPLAGLKFRG